MTRTLSFKQALALSAASAFFISACSSNGTTRVASVGQTRMIEKAGPQSSTAAQGEPGPQGMAGTDGRDGNVNLGGAGALATGGLIGPNGLAGTGLLANTGDPENSPELLSQGLIITGEQASLAAGAALYSANLVDDALPGGTPIAGTVLGVADNTGQALVQAGNGEIYLIDGLAAAPGDIITASIGDATAIGGGEDSLIGLSVLSGDQQDGDLLAFGAGSGGDVASLDTALTGDVGDGVEETVGGVTAVIPVSGDGGLDDLGDLAGIIDPVSDAVDDTLGDPLGGLDETADSGEGLLGGLLGAN